MKFGVAITTSVTPAVTETAQVEFVHRLTPVIEGAGFDSIWVSDRTVYPADMANRYPDRFGPGRLNPDAQNILEALTALSFVAGATSRVRLGISVLVLPFRNPVLNAKMVTTLDVLSGGRVIYGVGVGWMPEEFEAMGASYEHRGALTDEHIEMFKALCTQDVPEYRGRHLSTEGNTFYPKPAQKPHPPIWIGGNTGLALRRSARLGDGWHGIRQTPEELSEKRDTLRRLCQEYGRDPESVQITLRATAKLGEPQRSPSGDRVPLTGQTGEIVDDLKRYQDAGLEYLVLSTAADDTDSTIHALERWADEVAPRV